MGQLQVKLDFLAFVSTFLFLVVSCSTAILLIGCFFWGCLWVAGLLGEVWECNGVGQQKTKNTSNGTKRQGKKIQGKPQKDKEKKKMKQGKKHPKKTEKQKGQGKEDQGGNPETIRKNESIRANLRIDSRETGHLSSSVFMALTKELAGQRTKSHEQWPEERSSMTGRTKLATNVDSSVSTGNSTHQQPIGD